MLRVRAFKAEDLVNMDYQGKQEMELGSLIGGGEALYRQLEGVHSGTYVSDAGRPIVCAGLVPVARGRYEAWAVFEEDIGLFMPGIVREMKKWLASYRGCRVQASVQADFAEAHRLMRILGFDLEAPLMVDYFGRGLHAALYAKVDR